ncbi:hypothetical protein CBOM_07388 [Ceraceosorus bombacis]|uniref:Uncharacterized protein n=1 Tax=Ceraceosorus bombacis TaxID=401625 RepID=A0A0P1BB23_9BASI|nr:hypothetical protein CBOM_07388 [Ceraceosorus bombacis]
MTMSSWTMTRVCEVSLLCSSRPADANSQSLATDLAGPIRTLPHPLRRVHSTQRRMALLLMIPRHSQSGLVNG